MELKLREIRIKKGISEEDFSEQLGITLDKLKKYEEGKLKIVRADFLKKVSSILEVSSDEILCVESPYENIIRCMPLSDEEKLGLIKFFKSKENNL